jgi:hypothetical protein
LSFTQLRELCLHLAQYSVQARYLVAKIRGLHQRDNGKNRRNQQQQPDNQKKRIQPMHGHIPSQARQ